MNRPLLRLPHWHHRWLHFTAAVLLTSGLGWLGVHYLLGEGAGELPHPLEPWLMRLHGLGAFAALYGLGLLSAQHVPSGWRMTQRLHRPQRHTGLGLGVLAGALVLSGYALYYLLPEAWRAPVGWMHAALGLSLVLLGTWHGRAHRRRHRPG